MVKHFYTDAGGTAEERRISVNYIYANFRGLPAAGGEDGNVPNTDKLLSRSSLDELSFLLGSNTNSPLHSTQVRFPRGLSALRLKYHPIV